MASLKEEELDIIQELITNKIKSDKFLLLSKDLNELLKKLDLVDINWFDLEKAKTMLEKGKDGKIYQKFIDFAITERLFGSFFSENIKFYIQLIRWSLKA